MPIMMRQSASTGLNASEREQLREKGSEGFSMTYHEALSKRIDLVKSKDLKPADFCVWACLLAELDWKSGQAKVSVKMLADRLGWTIANTNNCLKRLRTHRMVAKGVRRDGGTYWMLNPDVCLSGGWKVKERRYAQWEDMSARDSVPEACVA